jgi:hypothetical protein
VVVVVAVEVRVSGLLDVLTLPVVVVVVVVVVSSAFRDVESEETRSIVVVDVAVVVVVEEEEVESAFNISVRVSSCRASRTKRQVLTILFDFYKSKSVF